MPGICAVRAAHPMHGLSPEDWTLWAVLHECGLSELLACPRGSGQPRTVRCPVAEPEVRAAEEVPDPGELDALDLLQG